MGWDGVSHGTDSQCHCNYCPSLRRRHGFDLFCSSAGKDFVWPLDSDHAGLINIPDVLGVEVVLFQDFGQVEEVSYISRIKTCYP